ncbi:MAG: ABC transporter permease [Pseudomonadota bacterium]
MPGRLVALVLKELLATLRDPRGRMVLIVPPILQLLIFAFAATLEVKNASMVVMDEDRGRWAVELTNRFKGSLAFADIRHVATLGDVRAAIDRQQAIVAVHIPQNFSGDVEGGRPADVQLILDGRRSNAAQIVQGYIAEIVEGLNDTIASQNRHPATQSLLITRNWFNPNLDYHWFTVPSLIGTLGLLLGLSVTALSIARERELGTFDQLLVSPLQPTEILIGKSVPSLLVGLGNSTVFLLIAALLFGIPFTGSILLFYLSLTVYLISVIGVGLFISSLSKTQQQAFLGAFVFAAPAILLSGFATPVENMPDWLQTFTQINPLRHFLVIVNGLFTKDMPLHTVFENAWPLMLIALVTMTSAAWLFRRRME